VQAANRRGGRGLSGDLVMLDELREHQSWDAWSAVTKTTMARPLAMVWAVSNAGDVSSVVLAHLRAWRIGRSVIPTACSPTSPTAATSSKSTRSASSSGRRPPGCAVDDEAGWVWANPSLGHTITERVIRDSIAVDPEAVTRTEVLCQWVDTFVPTVMPLTLVGDLRPRGPPARREAGYALDVDTNAAGEEWCSIGVSDGEHIEVVTSPDATPGLAWVVAAVVAKKARFDELLIDPKGPAGKLIEPLEKAGVKVRRVKPEEFVTASQQFKDAVIGGEVVHIDQDVLNRAVSGATKKDVGDGAWKFSRTGSSVDISPLIVVALARWAALQADADYDVLDSVLGPSEDDGDEPSDVSDDVLDTVL
jgi:hypothetical protein